MRSRCPWGRHRRSRVGWVKGPGEALTAKHGRDFGRVPARDVLVERRRATQQTSQVGGAQRRRFFWHFRQFEAIVGNVKQFS